MATVLATVRASSSEPSPLTLISITCSEPSPSRTIERASVPHTCSSPASSSARPTRTPDAPEASATTLSFVLVSPSTLQALKVLSLAA